MHDYGAAHFNLGISYQNLGRFRDSLESFEKSLALSPNHRTRILLASAANNYLREHGSADEHAYEIATDSLDHIDFVIENSSIAYPRAYYLRCLLGQLLGYPNFVNVKFCKDALLANQSVQSREEMTGCFVIEDVVLNTIGLLHKEDGNDDEAIEYFTEGLNINPMSSDIMVNLGSIYSAHEKYGLSEECFQRAERLITHPASRSLLMTNRGFSLEKQGYHLAAKSVYEEAIGIAGSSPHPQLLLNLENIERYCRNNACN